MIAIPLSKKDSTKLNSDYSSAPFFALLDTTTGSFRVIESSSDIIDLFKECSISSTIAYTKEDLLETLSQNDITVYTSHKNNLTLEEIYRKSLSNKFAKMYN